MKQERLTRKVCSMYDDSFEYCCNKTADKFDGGELIRANQKLGQLEDIEEEFGIDLIALLKPKTVWCKVLVENNQTKERSYRIVERNLWGINLEDKEIMIGSPYSFRSERFENYGKTWALTEGELK